jgi:hypothetical protein
MSKVILCSFHISISHIQMLLIQFEMLNVCCIMEVAVHVMITTYVKLKMMEIKKMLKIKDSARYFLSSTCALKNLLRVPFISCCLATTIQTLISFDLSLNWLHSSYDISVRQYKQYIYDITFFSDILISMWL